MLILWNKGTFVVRYRLLMTPVTVVAIALLGLAQTQPPVTPKEQKWLTNFKEAQKLAAKEKKPMLVNFTGSDWCGWCIKLHQEVFSKDDFKVWAKQKVVLVELDYPSEKVKQSKEIKNQNSALLEQYDIEGLPTVLFLDEKGNKLAESGYLAGGPLAWTDAADKLLAEALKRKVN